MKHTARFTVRLSTVDGERVERVRKRLSFDDATFSENKVLSVIVRRGLDSLERDLGTTNEAPRKAA